MVDQSTLRKYAMQVIKLAHVYQVDYWLAGLRWPGRHDVTLSEYNRIIDLAEKLDIRLRRYDGGHLYRVGKEIDNGKI